MAYVPYAPQKGARYVLESPGGVLAVLNDPTDPNYVGMVSDIVGLDSAEVRESFEDLTGMDGAVHGDFYYGRRPIVITVQVYGFATMEERDLRLDRITRASDAMRADSILSWRNRPALASVDMQTWVRRQQPLRITGGWTKEVQIPLVSELAPLFSVENHSATAAAATAVNAENVGRSPSFPILRIAGAAVNPTVSVTGAGGGVLKTTGLTIGAGEWVEIDTLTHEAVWHNGNSANRHIDWSGITQWPYLGSGNNVLTPSAGTLTVTWRDVWA